MHDIDTIVSSETVPGSNALMQANCASPCAAQRGEEPPNASTGEGQSASAAICNAATSSGAAVVAAMRRGAMPDVPMCLSGKKSLSCRRGGRARRSDTRAARTAARRDHSAFEAR